jgi:hypothetical protein
MTDLTIITNNVPREILYGSYLTDEERAEFDYYDWDAIDNGNNSVSFFRYKGQLYDLGDYERSDTQFEGWDGYYSETFFSGIVFRYVDDFEQVVVGRYYS